MVSFFLRPSYGDGLHEDASAEQEAMPAYYAPSWSAITRDDS